MYFVIHVQMHITRYYEKPETHLRLTTTQVTHTIPRKETIDISVSAAYTFVSAAHALFLCIGATYFHSTGVFRIRSQNTRNTRGLYVSHKEILYGETHSICVFTGERNVNVKTTISMQTHLERTDTSETLCQA